MYFTEWVKNCSIGSNGVRQAPIWDINKQDKQALQNVEWFGRNQILNAAPNLTYFLDGAHTIESIQLCSKWYIDLYPKSQM